MGMDVWKQIKTEGNYALYSWTVKADVATVFLPTQLKQRLGDYPETASGTYIEACNKVLMGFFGNMEIVSKTGMQRFLEQFEAYYANNGKCWRWDTQECKKKWQYGPWGEDLFMQFCLDDAAVAKKADFTLTDTGTCPGMRPKTEKDNAVCAFLYRQRCLQICSCPSFAECVCVGCLLQINFGKMSRTHKVCAFLYSQQFYKFVAVHPLRNVCAWDACYKSSSAH